MKILFLCGVYPPHYKNKIAKYSKRGYQFAAQNYQEALIAGFQENNQNISIVTVPFVSTFPFGYKMPFVYLSKQETDSNTAYLDTFFVNLPLLKNSLNICKTQVYNWCKKNKDEKELHIIVYALTKYFVKIATGAQKKFPNVGITIIILDLPEYMSSNRYYKILGLSNKNIEYIQSNIKYFDKYVLLTKEMGVRLGIKPENYCVIEGIHNEKNPNLSISDKGINILLQDKKYVFYSGALSEKYGIMNLVKAFKQILDEELYLVLCGEGELKESLMQISKADTRVKYLGKLDNNLVKQIQRNAALLVNPRLPENSYTKYSFPSKIIEYMSSGVPVLMYKLQGIPSEYFNYCFTLDDLSIKSLSKKMYEIINLPDSKKNQVAESAKIFIQDNKNAKNQVAKILSLIKKTS